MSCGKNNQKNFGCWPFKTSFDSVENEQRGVADVSGTGIKP